MKKFWDALFLVSSVLMVIFFSITLIYTITFFTRNYPSARILEDQLFYIGVGAAVFSTLAQFIEGRLNAINKLTKGVKNGRGKEKRRKA